MICFCFFFSSRRRHTRCYRDWSSDVCSSDLRGRRARRGAASAGGRETAGQCYQAQEAATAQQRSSRDLLLHTIHPFPTSGNQTERPAVAVCASHACRMRTASLATSIAVCTPSLTIVSVSRLATTAHTLPPRRPYSPSIVKIVAASISKFRTPALRRSRSEEHTSE